MSQILGSTMLDQQQYRQQLTESLKCAPISHDPSIRETTSDDNNSSNTEQISADLYDNNQIWTNNLDEVTTQMLQSLTMNTSANTETQSNQSSSSAYSSSYSSPTSTSNGQLGQLGGNSLVAQQQSINSFLSNQSKLNEWTSGGGASPQAWHNPGLQAFSGQTRPPFNGTSSNPPIGFGNNWSNSLAAQLMSNSQIQNYLMRNSYKMPSPRRSNFGSRDSQVMPSKARDAIPRVLSFNNPSSSNDKMFMPPTSNSTESVLYELLSQDNPELMHPSIQDSPIRKFHYDPPGEKYSRKVFVGGLPPDIDEREIHASFCHFGSLDVDWPHKSQSRAPFPPKGYAFLLFHEEYSVQALISMCKQEGGKYYYYVSSPTLKDKQNVGREFVQIRPWSLQDADFVMDGSQPLDPRKTIFVGGVPRPLRSVELAVIMNKYYSGVCYAGIDVDPELKYPKGAGRVAFSNHTSYINAINNRFIQLKIGDIDKKVEVKPYVMDDQMCDECNGEHSGGKYAPFFCGHISCLRYFCEHCWGVAHAQPGREFHKPLVKEGADRSRSLNFRW